jgi:hypothetical protein
MPSQEATMPGARHIILCALACALLLPATSAAEPSKSEIERALAQERYYMGQPQPTEAELAQERYYSSYGEPAALNLPQAPAAKSGTPWLLIALSVAAAATVVALSSARLRRLRVRRRAIRAAS